MNLYHKVLLICLLHLWFLPAAHAQTMGLMLYDSAAFEGYTLLAPSSYTTTYLIDNCGRKVHEWPGTLIPGAKISLESDGTLWRSGRMSGSWTTGGGYFAKVDWDNNILWSYTWADETHHAHHDFAVLPGGNLLIIAYERHFRADALARGFDSTFTTPEIWSEQLTELQPMGTDSAAVVWQWHLWDHLIQDFDSSKLGYGVVSDHPEWVDINYPGHGVSDWIHMNSINYREDLDQVLVSARETNEIWIIDHGTTTAEAASHSGGRYGKGGDLLYRWGNPAAYQRGGIADQKLFGQHDASWIPDSLPQGGNVMIFNNGAGRPISLYSSVDILELPMDSLGNFAPPDTTGWGPDTLLWSYMASPDPDSFFSSIVSGAQRLPNGNTLICGGENGTIFEINPAGQTIWKYINPVTLGGPMTQGTPPVSNLLFRAYRFPPLYPAFTGRDMVPGDRIELSPLPLPKFCESVGVNPETLQEPALSLWPDPAVNAFRLSGLKPGEEVQVWTMAGTLIKAFKAGHQTMGMDCSEWPAGIYVIRTAGRKPLRMMKI